MRTASSSTFPRAGSRRWQPSSTAVFARSRFATCPSFVWATAVQVGEVAVDIAFGGAFYASLRERVEPGELPRLIELGRAIKRGLEAEHEIVHPLEPELRDVYGVIFWQEEERRAADPAQRDRLRRRRGRPLALRLGHLGPAGARSTPRERCRAVTSSAISRSSARASPAASSARRQSPAGRPSSPR